MTEPSVLLTTDGTYPCYRGGVSVWCDQIIRQMPTVPFHVFAITHSPSAEPLFKRPSNLVSQRFLPLWGTPEPEPMRESVVGSLLRRLQTTPERIRNEFLPPFETLLAIVLNPSLPERGKPQRMAEAMTALHQYFVECDYAKSVSSPEAWNAFLRASRDQRDEFSLEEATKCMRWLQRYLSVVAVMFPPTDVVHASMAGLAGIPGVLGKILGGSGFVLTEHGIYLRELYLSLGRMKESTLCRRFLFRWYEAVVRMNYSYADSVSSLCQFNRRWQVQMGGPHDNIEIIPNGVDSEVFHPVERPSNPPAPTVLTMARIYRLKGIDHLLRAIHIVSAQLPNVRWRILGEVGDREYYADCLKLADKLGIADSIEWSQTSDPASAYRQADVLCLPSISEAMPYTVLEAMFSGCPVVATDVGGVAEMVGTTGLVVPPRNPQRMAQALISLLAGEGAGDYRRELSARALERARERYEIAECSQRFYRTYERLSRSGASTRLLAAR